MSLTISPLNLNTTLTQWSFESYVLLPFIASYLFYLYLWFSTKSPKRDLLFTSIGFILIGYSLFSFLDLYNKSLFFIHVIQHMLMTMIATPFLALGRPIRLIIKASNRKSALFLSKLSHRLRFLLNPIFTSLFMVGTLYILYFSTLYGHTLHNQFLHAVVHLHMIITGMLFSISILGIDSMRVAPIYLRLIALLIALPLHAFLGVSIMESSHLISMHETRNWGISQSLDQYLGGAILWGSGDLTSMIYVTAIFIVWSKTSRRKGESLNRIMKEREEKNI